MGRGGVNEGLNLRLGLSTGASPGPVGKRKGCSITFEATRVMLQLEEDEEREEILQGSKIYFSSGSCKAVSPSGALQADGEKLLCTTCNVTLDVTRKNSIGQLTLKSLRCIWSKRFLQRLKVRSRNKQACPCSLKGPWKTVWQGKWRHFPLCRLSQQQISHWKKLITPS